MDIHKNTTLTPEQRKESYRAYSCSAYSGLIFQYLNTFRSPKNFRVLV